MSLTVMGRRQLACGAFAVSLSLTGCAPITAINTYSGPPLAPINSEAVLFYSPKDVPQSALKVPGIRSGLLGGCMSIPDTAQRLQAIQAKAARMGANGVLVVAMASLAQFHPGNTTIDTLNGKALLAPHTQIGTVAAGIASNAAAGSHNYVTDDSALCPGYRAVAIFVPPR